MSRVRVHAKWRRSGLQKSATSVRMPKLRFSLSSGAGHGNRKPDGRWMDSFTMRCRSERSPNPASGWVNLKLSANRQQGVLQK